MAKLDPGLDNLRQAAVTMVATLGSFATALAIKHSEQLSTSVVILAVALALTMGRHGQRAGHRTPRVRMLAIIVVPLVAVAANEIGTQIFSHPDLGDALFVLAVSATIWARRLGPVSRRVATLATFPLIAMLIVPAPIIEVNGSTGDTRWWSALIALVALAWVTGTRAIAERTGVIPPSTDHPAPVERAAQAPRNEARRTMTSSSKMAIQMAAALGAAFVVGRGLFGTHWTWVVLTAFIVCSGNRGRGDVVYKAALRLGGAALGTLAATVLTGAFPAGDAWSIVVIFIVLFAALWLRPVSYAYWAAGMTAALALLYGYYGDRGIGLLGTRLEGILVGAVLGVAASWVLWPVRTTDVLRRDTARALAALDDYLAGFGDHPDARLSRQEAFRHSAATLGQTSTPLRVVPARFRTGFDYLPVADTLQRCAETLPSITHAADRADVTEHRARLGQLRSGLGEMRRANGKRIAPETEVCALLLDRIRELQDALAGQGPGTSTDAAPKEASAGSPMNSPI